MALHNGFKKGNSRFVLFILLLACFFTILLPAVNSFARDVSFTWTANTDDPPVDGYRLYYKIGDPGVSLSDYNGTGADNGNSPLEEYLVRG